MPAVNITVMTLYQELAEQTARLIREGIVLPGEKLPSIRQACKTHHVSPVTVIQAYQLLETQGLIEARPKSGFVVRARLGQLLPEPEATLPVSGTRVLAVSDFIFQILESVRNPDVIPLGSSFPSPFLFPLDKLGKHLATAARRFDPLSTVTDIGQGNEALRRQIALRYLHHGARVSPQEIVVTSGAMEGLNLCLQAVCQPGDLIAIESPTFYAGLQAIERLGLKVIEIPTSPRDGVDVSALASVLQEHPVKACLFMLNFSNPTGASLPPARKRELIDLLCEHQVPLIEDDVYGELYFGSEAPLCTKAIDPDGLVMHVSSFSKCLAPGYRVGWIAAGRYAAKIERLKLSTSLATTVPVQIAIADYLKHGGFDHHLRQLRQKLAAHAATLIQAIEQHFPAGTRLSCPRGGYFLWLELPHTVDALRLHQEALAQGISTAPGPIFSATRQYTHHLRLNFGHMGPAAMDAAVVRLAALIARQML